MASRQPRKAPFLDDPSLYPEYALLVQRQRLHHALRCGFHRHRYPEAMFCDVLCSETLGIYRRRWDVVEVARYMGRRAGESSLSS